jgi:DNA-binding Lrp family transcriptional regulator
MGPETGRELDDVDRSILYLLRRDARDTTAESIADTVGVSASTIRNRIDRLEDDGIIRGYHPEIDYERANLPLQITFIVSAPPTELEEYSERIRRIQGVIDVREMLTGRRNSTSTWSGRARPTSPRSPTRSTTWAWRSSPRR